MRCGPAVQAHIRERERSEPRRLEDLQPRAQVPWGRAVSDLLAWRNQEIDETRSREGDREPRALGARLHPRRSELGAAVKRTTSDGPTRKPVAPTARPKSAETPARQLAGFLAKFDPAMASRIRSVRSALRKRLPTAIELVYDNYNFFVIGYGPTERASDAVLSLAANSKGVGLAFLHGATLPDPQKILQGSGTQNRFIRLESAATLAKPAVEALIRAAFLQAKAPWPKTGGGHLAIKSVSIKQRPRRLVP